jgi:hypothetical protein
MTGGPNGLLSSQVDLGLSDNNKLLGFYIHDTVDAGEAHSHPIYLSAEQHDTEVGWFTIANLPQSRAVVQVHTDPFSGSCFAYKAITNITIHDFTIHHITGQALLFDGGTGDITVYNGVIYQAPYQLGALTNSDEIALRSGGNHLNLRFYNNTVVINPRMGNSAAIFGSGLSGYFPESVWLKNNVFVLTSSEDTWMNSDNSTGSFNTWLTSGALVSDYNIFYGVAAPSWAGSHSLAVDPKFVNPVSDFHLQATSPAIGVGTTAVNTTLITDHDGLTRGAAYDMGAHEYNSESIPADSTPPGISAEDAGTPTQTAATITWTTDEAADSQVEYGPTASYGSSTTLNVTLATSHSEGIAGLTASTTYHYRVKSRDAAGNLATGSDHTFVTAAIPDTTGPAISNVTRIAGTTSFVMTGATDENAVCQPEWGLTAGYGSSGEFETTYGTQHSVTAQGGVLPETTYHSRLVCKDASNNSTNGADDTITTYSDARGSSTTRGVAGARGIAGNRGTAESRGFASAREFTP